MPAPIKLPKQQLKRVHELESRFNEELRKGNLKSAKLILNNLKDILKTHFHAARLLENYLKLYETAMESWQISLARKGFEFVRNNASVNTRLYLEATTLLAICHLREKNIDLAEPFMAEVLKNDKGIKSESKRFEFRAAVIERFDQEGALAALSESTSQITTLSEDDVHKEAIEILRQGKSEDDLREMLGASVPESVKDYLFRIDTIAKNLLSYEQRKMLPGPKEVIKNRNLGSVLFGGFKRKLYKYICDEKSDVYQAWLKSGLNSILDKGYLASIVVTALADLRIGASALAVRITALIMNQGITNFCNNNKPRSLMLLRKKSNKAAQGDVAKPRG